MRYWEEVNDTGGQATVCFRYRRNDAPAWLRPRDDQPYENPEPGSLPGPACETPFQPLERDVISWREVGLVNGDRSEWCASEWRQALDQSWSGGPWLCETVRIDTVAPVTRLILGDRNRRQGATNDPVLIRAIRYADDVSPAAGDTRICRSADRYCTSADAFDYDRDCSDEPLGLSVTFSCTLAWSGGDQTVYQCGLSFDSAVGDRAPDRTRAPAPDNPDWTTPGTGNYAIACDSITLDRTAPRVTVTASSTRASVGERVRLSAAALDDRSGLDGRWRWDLGDGTIVTTDTSTLEHAFSAVGRRTVRVTREDVAGNAGEGTIDIAVSSDPGELLKTSVPRRAPAGSKVKLQLTTGLRGKVMVKLRRDGRTLRTLRGTVGPALRKTLTVALPAGRRGAYELAITFTPTGRDAPSARRTVRVTATAASRGSSHRRDRRAP